MELISFLLFAAALIVCIAADIELLFALIFGYIVFFMCGLRLGHSGRALIKMSLKGIYKGRNVVITLCLIGVLTAAWRCAGTIPMIIYSSSHLISPKLIILSTFLLCGVMSVLTGSAFGTSATMGVICMTIGQSMGAEAALMGGAVLAGSFFGDRCSPMSSSALLVSEVTETNIFSNIRLMIKSAFIPLVGTCALYLIAGFFSNAGAVPLNVLEEFKTEFNLHWSTLIPAAAIIIMSMFKIRLRTTIIVSIAAGALISIFVQHMSLSELLKAMIVGYRSSGSGFVSLLSGGGLISMIRAAAIVCLSTSYSGIFEGTGLLTGMIDRITAFSAKTTPFITVLAVSAVVSAISCNQTLAAILTKDLCTDVISNNQEMAITLEDTVIVTAPLFPWSIACAVPLTSVGAPFISIVFAFYLYLIPLWQIIRGGEKRIIS